MARVAPLIGIIAVTALIIFGLSGCPVEEEDEKELTGTLTIRVNNQNVSGTLETGAVLTAVYNTSSADEQLAIETEGLEYQWLRDSSPISGTSVSYTANDPGLYAVKVSLKGYLSKTSTAVTVAQPYASFLGTWFMEGSKQNPQWTGGDTGPNNETITITATEFKLLSTYGGIVAATPQTETYKDDQGYKTGTMDDDYAASKEYINWTITKWEAIATGNLPSGYSSGYTLTVTCTGFKGYSPFSSFKIYMKSSTTNPTIQRTQGEKHSPQYGILDRPYIKQ